MSETRLPFNSIYLSLPFCSIQADDQIIQNVFLVNVPSKFSANLLKIFLHCYFPQHDLPVHRNLLIINTSCKQVMYIRTSYTIRPVEIDHESYPLSSYACMFTAIKIKAS